MRRPSLLNPLFLAAALLIGLALPASTPLAWIASVMANESQPITLALAASAFEWKGDWTAAHDKGHDILMAAGPVHFPAATAIKLPQAGRYRLWAMAKDYPDKAPGSRTFSITLGGHECPKRFGASGKPGYTWEDGGWLDLPGGPLLVTIDKPHSVARIAGIILTTSDAFTPYKPVESSGLRSVTPIRLRVNEPDAAAPPLQLTPGPAEASLSNEWLRVKFSPAASSDGPVVAIQAEVNSPAGWIDAHLDSAVEQYVAVVADRRATLGHDNFFPKWPRWANKPQLLTVGGVSVRTISDSSTAFMREAGECFVFRPLLAHQKSREQVVIDFAPTPAGQLSALWELAPGQHSAAVTLTLKPAAEQGQISLGYAMPFKRDPSAIAEVLLPPMWQRHRMPSHPISLPDSCMPTPLSLAQTVPDSSGAVACFAVAADPHDAPFQWPDGRSPRTALSLTSSGGQVQPAIWGPVIGAGAAIVNAASPVTLRFHMLIHGGDWYSGYRTIADEVDQLTDYRKNAGVSLTDAALNMIDLIMDDAHGGWWDRAGGFYQIETKNGATHASPMTLLSLYRLTGDERLYRQRALPAMQYMLSRDLPHFSPEPDDTGSLYPAGSMNGPVKLFGTSTFGGLWELTGRRSGVFADIALPNGDVRPTAGYSHAQAFDEWLSRYLLTGEKADLDRACALADTYLKSQVLTPPSRELGQEPFFYISFVPDWEGLLRMYEVTGKQSYLDGAVLGAHQLMTGVWTQPLVPSGDVTVHPGGQFAGDSVNMWWRGPERYKLGWPLAPGAIAEHQAPAWEVANVGLGFEQPSTLNASGPARQVYEAAWAPAFLRLYRYTHEPALLTYARNAVIGRWANYPGYYAVGQTDLPLDPGYPLHGPDVTDFYYHHIPPHLAWTIDYLVSEAEMLSNGQITFPSLRQHGYAYFDSRIFGHAAGKIFDDADCWLVFRRSLATLDNPQINYLTAFGRDGLHVILMNESREEQTVKLTVHPDEIKRTDASAGATYSLGLARMHLIDHDSVVLQVPARQWAVYTLGGARPMWPIALSKAEPTAGEKETNSSKSALKIAASSLLTIPDAAASVHATAIQSRPTVWDTYIWSTASPRIAKSATLHYSTGGAWQSVQLDHYPFEFTIPMMNEQAVLTFHLDLTLPDGRQAAGGEGMLKLTP